MRRALYGGLVLLFLLRFDLWAWRDGRILLGLPVGLTYHVLYCLGVVLYMWLLVRYAWPEVESDAEQEEAGS